MIRRGKAERFGKMGRFGGNEERKRREEETGMS